MGAFRGTVGWIRTWGIPSDARGRAHLDSAAIINGLLYAAIFYVVGWVGPFLINFVWSTPATLYTTQAETIERLNSQISSRSVSVKEQENRETVRSLIAGATDNELVVLKILRDHDEIFAPQLYELSDRAAIGTSIGQVEVQTHP
jgi:hypothetical protein